MQWLARSLLGFVMQLMVCAKITLREARPKNGFTLIELLTVIAIIGILAAIIIPTVTKVRETARFAKGAANLREIARASLLFADENKGWIPSEGDGTMTASNNRTDQFTPKGVAAPWWNELPKYMSVPKLYYLESNRMPLPKFGDNHPFICPNATVNSTSSAPAWACYGPNKWLSENGQLANIRLAGNEPSRTVLFAETTNHAPGQTGRFSNANPKYLGEKTAVKNGSRWGNKCILSFFDGSVRSYPQSDLLAQEADTKGTKGGPIWDPR